MSIGNLNLSPDEKLAQKVEADLAQTPKPKVLLNQTTHQFVSQPINQPIDQSIDQSIDSLDDQLSGKVVDRPVAFYLPETIDRKIDEAVSYYHEKHKKRKVDRSAVVSAILGNPELWTDRALDHLVAQVIKQLTNRLTSRLVD